MITPQTHPHGACECSDGTDCRPCTGPAAFEVVRGNRKLRLCPLCVGATDVNAVLLVRSVLELPVYEAYDPTWGRLIRRALVQSFTLN